MNAQFIISKTSGNVGLLTSPDPNVPFTVNSDKGNWRVGINVKTIAQFNSGFHLDYKYNTWSDQFYANSQFIYCKGKYTASDSSIKKISSLYNYR